MKTPWTHLGELSDFEMGVWILLMLVIGGTVMVLLGGIAERIGDRLRKWIGDYQPEPPRYWRHHEGDSIH
jgi:hypothetical protein